MFGRDAFQHALEPTLVIGDRLLNEGGQLFERDVERLAGRGRLCRPGEGVDTAEDALQAVAKVVRIGTTTATVEVRTQGVL